MNNMVHLNKTKKPLLSTKSNEVIREIWRAELKGHLISQKDDSNVVRLPFLANDYYPGGDAA